MTVLRRILRSSLIILISLVLITGSGTLQLTPIEEQAKAHLYSLIQWEMENFMDKWLYRAKLLLPSNSSSEHDNKALVLEYFRLGEQQRNLEGLIQRDINSTSGLGSPSKTHQESLMQIVSIRDSMRDMVEEVAEGVVDSVIDSEGLYWGGPPRFIGVHFPPVDFRLDPSPRVLVVSHRSHIEMIDGILIEPSITIEEIEALEKVIQDQNEDISVLVEATAGVATYPAIISPNSSLKNILITAAHEWLHHYLFFRPLGRTYGRDAKMTTINETSANIFGQEIGDMAFQQFQETTISTEIGDSNSLHNAGHRFDFIMEMRKTRTRVEELLSEGMVEEAEQYMEVRRQFLWNNGYLIRRLNQAYFAFHGSYADSPGSISPIFEQLSSLRAASPSLGHFIKQVASISSYREFLDMLDTNKRLQ